MTTTISTMDMRKSLGDFLNKVSIRHDEYIIERKGEPLAAMIPVLKLQTMDRAARLQITDILDRPNSKLSDEEALALALEAKASVRRK